MEIDGEETLVWVARFVSLVYSRGGSVGEENELGFVQYMELAPRLGEVEKRFLCLDFCCDKQNIYLNFICWVLCRCEFF